jgi:hypothetical protein
MLRPKAIVWLYDCRDHPKGLDGLRTEDLPAVVARCASLDATIIAWRPTASHTEGVGAIFVEFGSHDALNRFVLLRHQFAKEYQTEFWLREWTPSLWFKFARRVLGPATRLTPARPLNCAAMSAIT